MSRLLHAPFFFLFLWVIVLTLYSMKLSVLYDPSVEVILSVFTSMVVFGVTSIGVKKILPQMLLCFAENEHSVFKQLMWFCFLAGTVAFVYEAMTITLPILKDNKMERETDHYIHYITDLLQLSAPMAYLDWRINKKKFSTIIFIASSIFLGMWLSRGFTIVLLVTVLVVEYILYLKNRSFRSMIVIFLFIAAFLGMFSFIGDYRMEYAYENFYSFSLTAQYGMSEFYPNWFVWFYIYLTSSLENLNFYIQNDNFEWNNGYLLIYPFAKLIFGIFGFNLPTVWEIIELPKLWYSRGLNVGSYLTCAIHDFSFLGLLIYPMAYGAIGYIQNYVIRANNQIVIIIQIYILTLYAWTPFYHSLAMGSLILNLIILLLAGKMKNNFCSKSTK